MRKNIKEIMDGAEPEELRDFDDEIDTSDALPEGVSSERIAEKAKARAGIVGRKNAVITSAVKKRSRTRMFVLIAAVLALTAITIGALSVGLSRRSGEQGPDKEGETGLPGGSIFNDGVIGANPHSNSADKGGHTGILGGLFDGWYSKDEDAEVIPEEMAPGHSKDDSYGDGVTGGTSEDIYYSEGNIQHPAGLLTASEWKDAKLENIAEWKKKLNDNNWYSLVKTHNIFAGNVIPVHVTSANGDAAIFNCKVELMSGGEVIFTGRTGIDGAAFLFYGIDGINKVPDAVRIGDKVTKLDSLDDTKALELTFDGKAEGVTALDLMLMVDTTGSMGDELEYLKAELADMVSRIGKTEKALSIRVSVNFYRDIGDEYIVKYFDFRTDINECVKQIAGQSAAGGGDYPEAVHTALDNAVAGHQWRNEAVKICFLVLDAPSHNGQEIDESLRKSLNTAAENGIRIIPVASSGVNTECEYLFRSFAAITGGTYIFLTNNSGIGGDHKEAEVGETNVEPLNECMIRVVCEYLGIEYNKPAAQNGNNQ
ncbi:MAG: VWA domain-containing protein [Clostridia bacterium]|nr:VWA domain-containing protein [Clostridia bacterium]